MYMHAYKCTCAWRHLFAHNSALISELSLHVLVQICTCDSSLDALTDRLHAVLPPLSCPPRVDVLFNGHRHDVLSFSCNSPAFDRVVIFEAVKRDGRRESDKEGALRGRGFKDQDERNQKAGEDQVQHVGWK